MAKAITRLAILISITLFISDTMGQGINKQDLPIDDTVVLKGEFVKHEFYNKAGRLIEGAYDVFFKTDEEEIFVKRIKCSFPQGELKDNLNISFEIKAVKVFGLWDADDNNVQSRVGDFLEIYEIIKITGQ